MLYHSVNGYTINTGTGVNHVNVHSPSVNGGHGSTVVGHGGADTVTIGSLAPSLGGTLTNIGPVTVSNTTNSTHVIVDDSGDPVARAVDIGFDTVQFLGIGGLVTFLAGVKSVDVFGGNDVFHAGFAAPVAQLTLHGGVSGTLFSGAETNTWIITSANAGTLQGTIAFQNIGNLRGSSLAPATDTFVFANQATVNSIQAGGFSDTATLDYAAYATPVIVDLKTGQATGVSSIAHIKNVIGGQGNNILVGDGNNNLLEGGSGRDILISGGGSVLEAGSGQAILIGAHYLFDTNLAALNALMAEWSRTDEGSPLDPTGYLARINHLQHGGGKNGPFLLNFSTVLAQPGSTQLVTGAGLDFLFSDLGDLLIHPLRPGEVDVFV